LRFNDIENPQLGGTITAVLDGTEGQQMMDNIGIDNSGHILIVEDIGGNAALGKVWEYTIATDAFVQIATHDADRFINGAPNFLTQDEEASGILDVQSILGDGKFIFVDQAHYSQASPVVEGGQLLVMTSAKSATSNPEINVMGNAVTIQAGDATASATDNTSFGTVNINTTANRSYVIQNTGTGVLNISNIVFSGTNAGDFTIVNPPVYPLTVAAGASISISVNFNTPIAGVRNASLNIVNNDLNEDLYNYAVQGTAAVAEINVQGNSVNIPAGTNVTSAADNTNFGPVMEMVALTKVFAVQNTGNGTLTVSGITISGANASEFTLVTPPAFPLTLVGGASQNITVQFVPTALGTRTAMININNTDADESTYSYKLEGQGTINTGINSVSNNVSFVNLFPNPAKDEAVLSVSLDKAQTVSVKVIDVLGKQVSPVMERELVSGDNQININTTELKNGVYFIQVEAGSKSNKIKMLVKH
jgi:hypothetical protein